MHISYRAFPCLRVAVALSDSNACRYVRLLGETYRSTSSKLIDTVPPFEAIVWKRRGVMLSTLPLACSLSATNFCSLHTAHCLHLHLLQPAFFLGLGTVLNCKLILDGAASRAGTNVIL